MAIWQINNKIALKEDPKIQGLIVQVILPYTPGDPTLYLVRWTGFSQDYIYLEEVLISKEAADKSLETKVAIT
jgi:hypothetical protein